MARSEKKNGWGYCLEGIDFGFTLLFPFSITVCYMNHTNMFRCIMVRKRSQRESTDLIVCAFPRHRMALAEAWEKRTRRSRVKISCAYFARRPFFFGSTFLRFLCCCFSFFGGCYMTTLVDGGNRRGRRARSPWFYFCAYTRETTLPYHHEG
mmetsp:Transcript_23935/g.60574  ORF Transcript_23935/g.60574 Transcript_23935/m.60574 type:complete len:152 (-) Transcript_23935:366-821(-)